MAFWETPEVFSGPMPTGTPVGDAKPFLGLGLIHTGIVTMEWALNFRYLNIPWNHVYMHGSNMPYDCSREMVVRSLLGYNVEYIMFVDTDVCIPRDGVVQLLELSKQHDKPVVSGVYFAKKHEEIPMPAAWVKMGEDLTKGQIQYKSIENEIKPYIEKNALVEVDVVGAGCLLIKSDVFKKLDVSNPNKPYFQWGLTRKDENTGKPLLQLCALPGQSILGGSKIEDVIAGERIPSSNGELNRVEYATSRIYDGEIMEITPSHLRLPIKVTEHHKILVLRGTKRTYQQHYEKETQCSVYDGSLLDNNNAEEKWIPASEITKDDYVGFPVISHVKDIKEFTFNNHQRSHLKKTIPVDDTFMEFLGWYAAEGNTDISKHSWQMAFSFGRHEIEYVNNIRRILKGFGLNSHVIDSEKYHATSVRASGKELVIKLKEWFGRDATTKTLPNWILYLPNEKIYPFLRAFWLGDGYKTYNGTYKHDVLGINIASKELAIGLVSLLIKIGVRPTLRHYMQHHTAMGKESYTIKVYGDSEKLVKLLNLPYTISERKQKKDRIFFFNNKLWMKVSDIKKQHYYGMVHDLRVEPPDNSYILETTIVHNSEDFYFCDRISRELGIKVHLATGVKCDHLLCPVGRRRASDGKLVL